MKVEGPNFGNYDAQHLQIVRREVPQSIKPNLFRDLDENVAQALLFTDMVNLSPEAKALLKKLRRQMAGLPDEPGDQESQDVKDLIVTLRQLRDLVYGKDEEEDAPDEETLWESARKGRLLNGNGKPPENGRYFHPPVTGNTRQSKAYYYNPPVMQLSSTVHGGGGSARPGGVVRDIVERMIVYSPSHQARQSTIDELVVLGEKVVDTVSRFGVKLIILEPQRALTDLRLAGMSVVAPHERTFDGRPWAEVRGLYDQSRRIMVLGQEKLGQPASSAARHEFAHAFDHTFTVRHSRRQPLSVQLWNLFAEQRRGLVTPYAGTNPAEYWAESVESFFKPNGRDVLRQCDPQMLQYLEALFAS